MEAELTKQLVTDFISDSGIKTLVYINCAALIIAVASAVLSVRYYSKVVEKFLIREDDLRNEHLAREDSIKKKFEEFVNGVNNHLSTLTQGIKELLHEHKDRKEEVQRMERAINNSCKAK